MNAFELEDASHRSLFSSSSYMELRRRLWLRIATKTACVLISMVLITVIGLTMASQESSLLPANIVRRAREIYVAELAVRKTAADALHAARVFSDTLINTSRRIWMDLATEEASFPPYVLVVTGEAGRREMSMYSRMEFLIYLADCPGRRSYAKRRAFFKSVSDFKYLMEAANIRVKLLNQPIARSTIRTFPCTTQLAVTKTLLTHDFVMTSRVLEGKFFFGDMNLYLQVGQDIRTWMLAPLERAAAAAPSYDDSSEMLWYAGRVPNTTLGTYLKGHIEVRKFARFYRKYYPKLKGGISPRRVWEVNSWLYSPMQDFIAAQVFQPLYQSDLALDALSSNTGDRLQWLLREGVWSERMVSRGIEALWMSLKVRTQAHARQSGPSKDVAHVCFSCEQPSVYKVPGDLQGPLEEAVRWLACLAHAHETADLSPDC